MLFEKEKYIKYIEKLEKTIWITYIIFILLGFIIGIFGKLIGVILGITLAILIASTKTINIKIRIQEMKWKIDIYEKYMKENKEC